MLFSLESSVLGSNFLGGFLVELYFWRVSCSRSSSLGGGFRFGFHRFAGGLLFWESISFLKASFLKVPSWSPEKMFVLARLHFCP